MLSKNGRILFRPGLPPSGLCTWYYYYQDINENEVKYNTDWIAKNLKEFGAKYVQIDDGWQAEQKNGKHGSRDWTGLDKAFPESGFCQLKWPVLKPGDMGVEELLPAGPMQY